MLEVVYLTLAVWTVVLMAPWRPWSTRERLDVSHSVGSARLESVSPDLDDLTVLVPARDEGAVINRCLDALQLQGAGLSVIVIDDGSTDDTNSIASRHAVGAKVVTGSRPEPGWSGKLWALQQGVNDVSTPLTLLLDADIELDKGLVHALRAKLEQDHLALVSVMAELRCTAPWERLLMPAFVYFFKLLYPFSLSNSRSKLIAAAAGGCVLVRTEILREGHALQRIRNEIIDDCALARLVKDEFGRTWIGLSHHARSLRAFHQFADVASMVARTAFTQLRYSAGLLLLCTAVMACMFGAPMFWLSPVALGPADAEIRLVSGLSFVVMCSTYVPMLRFYRRPWFESAVLPFVGVAYLVMTWQSAWNHWTGKGALWKGRVYTSDNSDESGESDKSDKSDFPDGIQTMMQRTRE